jgi:hypothetical protein
MIYAIKVLLKNIKKNHHQKRKLWYTGEKNKMYLNNEFLNEIKFLVEKCLKTKFPHTKQLLLLLDNESIIYYLNIEVLSSQNNSILNLTDDFLLDEINIFVQKVFTEKQQRGQLKLPFNIANISKDVIISIIRCNKNLNCVYLVQDSMIMREEKKEQLWKDKILFIIQCNPSGIALNEITNRTRGIKNPVSRKQYLRELVQENKIEMFQSGRYSKRPKTFYRIKTNETNENITPDNSGSAYSEAAGAEGQTGMV